MPLETICQEVDRLAGRLAEITGGEPLLQEEVYPLAEMLLDKGYTVLIETNGSIDIGRLDRRVHIIMDIKCPGSGMSEKNSWNNIGLLAEKDEVKIVIKDMEDYLWAKGVLEGYPSLNRCTIFFSPVHGIMDPKVLARWIIEDNLPVRVQVQLHKYLGVP